MRGFFGVFFALALFGCGSSDDSGGNHAGTGGTSASGGSGGAGGSGGSAASGGTAGATGGQSGVELTLPSGKLAGAVVGKTRVFRGVPYAEPPLGALRWKSPQPKQPWSGVFDATKPGPMCAQLDALGLAVQGTEDCLTLDVWSPDPAPSAPRPVMVWIHGGGFYSGTGTYDTYAGTNLVPAGDVVLVDINYRLGVFGFLAHPLLTQEDPSYPSSGNYGFEDQQLALQWVHDNIAAFGGDPANVTIFGESAGGISVCTHLVAAKSAGLFQRAIDESGPCTLVTQTLAASEAQGKSLATVVNCSDLACLRAKPMADLVKALPLKKAVILGTGASWAPNIDGVDLLEAPAASIAAGKAAKVPVILGTNADEGALFTFIGGLGSMTDPEYQATIQAIGAGLGYDPAKVLAQYPSSSYPSPADALAQVLTDGGFTCPTRKIARELQSAGQSVYLYYFTHPIPVLGIDKAIHTAELPFVFDSSMLGYTPTGAELDLSKAMMGYWTRFASAGDPNGSGAVAWPKYDAASDQHLVLDLGITAGSGLKKTECDFWDGL